MTTLGSEIHGGVGSEEWGEKSQKKSLNLQREERGVRVVKPYANYWDGSEPYKTERWQPGDTLSAQTREGGGAGNLKGRKLKAPKKKRGGQFRGGDLKTKNPWIRHGKKGGGGQNVSKGSINPKVAS